MKIENIQIINKFQAKIDESKGRFEDLAKKIKEQDLAFSHSLRNSISGSISKNV
jgi:hypothetical protein